MRFGRRNSAAGRDRVIQFRRERPNADIWGLLRLTGKEVEVVAKMKTSGKVSPRAGLTKAGGRNGQGSPKSAGARHSREATDKASEQAKQALEFALGQIHKRCGQGAIMYLGANYKANIPVISTGILSLDVATGIGGVPCGRIMEIYGPES